LVRRQSQTSPVLSNSNPQNPNAVGGLSRSAGAADSIDLQQAAILGAFLLSSTPSAATPNDVYATSGATDSVAASPLPGLSADAISGESGFQTAAIADTSNVATGDASTGAPLALNQHASDESGQSVTDTGINVGVLPASFGNLGDAAQAVADGALPPISDIQTLNELSSGGSDEVQIVHDVAHGASMVFYPADNGGQNLATGIPVTNAANAQDAASNAPGTASITAFSVSTNPTIATAGMTSVALSGDPAPGTAVAIPSSYEWAVQGSPSGSQSGTGSVVTVTSGGITFDLLFDAGAPASFETGIEQAASILAAAISDKITVNLNIHYSGTGGGAFAGPDSGIYESYSSIRTDLINNATPGDTIFNALPSGSSIQGQTTVAAWNAQLKLFGLLAPNDTSTDDGSATFATDINPSLLIGVALHELTHAMGRVPFGSAPDIFDLFRFTSAGNYLFSGNIPVPSAYFSVNGGTTNLAYYGQNSDPSDLLNVSPNLTDPFDEYYSGSTTQTLTPLDLEQLDALGFNLTSSSPSTVSVAYFIANESSLNSIAGGFAISDTAANVQANLAAIAADASHITSITATGGPVTVGTAMFVADAAALNLIVGGFAVSDTAANVQANLAALTADASHITSITATGGPVTVGTGLFAADQAALNKIVGGFAISDMAANVQANLAALTADASHITSITATGGQVTVGTGLFVADAAALNEIVGGFAISDTAANVQANLAALAADASHITSITATGGPVTVGTGLFVADQAALNKIVGGFAISDTAANIQANLAALTADASHITMITATGGPTGTTTTVYSNGVQVVASGNTNSGTTLNGGTQLDYGTASGTTVNSNGVQYVETGGTANSTTVNSGGVQNDYGTASGTTLNGGDQYVHGSASGTVVSTGSIQDILAGGTASSTTINSGGAQYDNGTASGTTVSGGGIEYVFSGGTESGTTVSGGGAEYVFSGGTSTSATLNGGDQYVYGSASGTVVSTGSIQDILSGGTASSATINSGGAQYDNGTASSTTVSGGGIEYVFSGSTASGTTLSGGSEIVMSGGIANGTITFAGSGQLTLNTSTNVNNFQISGFNASSDKLDLADITYSGKTTLSFAEANNNTSGTLTVSDILHTANITLLGLYTTQNFTAASDGHGGTIIFV
jgi:serralysin